MTPEGGVCPKDGKLCLKGRKRARAKAAASKRVSGYPIYIYKCRFCHHWHLTHLNPKGPK